MVVKKGVKKNSKRTELTIIMKKRRTCLKTASVSMERGVVIERERVAARDEVRKQPHSHRNSDNTVPTSPFT